VVVATKGSAVLRHARDGDLEAVDALTVESYRPIFESYVTMLGEDCYDAVRLEPELSWKERKIQQNRRLFDEHPNQLWVLEEGGDVNAHILARRAYEETGFDRQVPTVEYWQDLSLRNPGSTLD
jgi:hypothetical protein